MKRYLALLALILSLGVSALGQSVALTGTVTDTDNQTWNNGTITFTFFGPQGSIYRWTGGTLNPNIPITSTLSSTGTYSVSIPDNSQITPTDSSWIVTACPAVLPATSGCFKSTRVITTANTTLNLTPPAPRFSVPSSPQSIAPITAYNDTEILGGWVGFSYFSLTAGSTRVCQSISGTTCSWISGGGTPAILTVTNSGASPGLADNATAFANVVTTFNAQAYVPVSSGNPTVRSSVATVMSNSTISSATATVNITTGDTVLVGTIGLAGVVLTYSVSDGTNTYYPVNLNSSPASTTNEQIQVFGTVPGAAKACSGCTLTVTITAGGPAQFGFIVLDAFNVGSYGQTNLFNNSAAGTTTPTVSVATQDNNNLIATWVDYCNAAGVVISANTGTLQQSWNSNATICGAGMVTNTAASLNTSVTTSATLASSSAWAVNGIELRSVTTLQPTIYFPAGRYTYSSGLNFTHPVTLKGEPGTVLCYTGTAHAVDMGPAGLVFATLQADPYIVDGIRFECGAGMTQGIFFQAHVIYGEVRNSIFYNFGNASATAIFSNGDTEDLRIVNNRFLIFDGSPAAPPIVPSRTFVNATTVASFSTIVFKANFVICAAGKQGPTVGCGGTSGPMLIAQSYANLIEGNSVSGGFCPAFRLIGGGNSAAGTRVINNNIETDQNNCHGIDIPSALDNVKIFGNFWSDKASTPTSSNFVGPTTGTDVIANIEVSNNSLVNNPTNNPVVALNNLAGQTNNLAWHNTCSTGQWSGTTPCPLTHTTGGNISQWNADYAGTCTMAAGACTAYNFLVSYAVAPKCTASWNGTGTLTGLIKVANTTANLTITSTVGTDTAVINWSCNPESQ